MSSPPPPGTTWDFELPDKLKIAIADTIVVFARMETILLETVWILEDSNLEEKKELTRDFVSKNFKKLKKVVKLLPGAETDSIWPTLGKLADERNLVAHGFWAITNEGRPLVLSHKFLESEDYKTAEFFDYRRFEYFVKRGEHLLNTFQLFKTMLEKLTKEERVAAGLTLPKKKQSHWRRFSAALRHLEARLRSHGRRLTAELRQLKARLLGR